MSQERIPKIGDIVWFYFRHAFGEDVEFPDGIRVEMFTGAMSMRCRRATVKELVTVVPDRVDGPFQALGTVYLELDVEFGPDDRMLSPGGVVHPPERRQGAAAHRGGSDYRVGKVGHAWPEHLTWAWDPMPGYEGGGR